MQWFRSEPVAPRFARAGVEKNWKSKRGVGIWALLDFQVFSTPSRRLKVGGRPAFRYVSVSPLLRVEDKSRPVDFRRR